MIIQIAGTNGSGKTTAMRKVLSEAKSVTELYSGTKIKGYKAVYEGVNDPVIIMGPYTEKATSGCDSLGHDADEHYALVEEYNDAGCHVLCEGIRIMNHTRGIELQKKTGCVHVLVLTTPLEECFEGINARRAAANNTRVLKSPKDIEGNVTRAKNYAIKIRDIGGRMYMVDRDEAPKKVLEILRGA